MHFLPLFAGAITFVTSCLWSLTLNPFRKKILVYSKRRESALLGANPFLSEKIQHDLGGKIIVDITAAPASILKKKNSL